MKKVLFLGASGIVGPHLIPGLEGHYDLRLTDVKPHPDGKDVQHLDVTCYEAVHEAARGMDAIMNFTVVRVDPDVSFPVNTIGAYHVMKAAAEHGVRKVIHTAPTFTQPYGHDFDVDDAPHAVLTNCYEVTKFLSLQICRIFAETHGIQTLCLLFGQLGDLRPTPGGDRIVPPFKIIWEDLQRACRQALELESVPGNFQWMHLMTSTIHEWYRIDKARRILGFEPQVRLEDEYRIRRR